MNFLFALWLIGLETGIGTIPANKVKGIFSQVLLGKVFLLQKKKKKSVFFCRMWSCFVRDIWRCSSYFVTRKVNKHINDDIMGSWKGLH